MIAVMMTTENRLETEVSGEPIIKFPGRIRLYSLLRLNPSKGLIGRQLQLFHLALVEIPNLGLQRRLRIARTWKARATESSGGLLIDEELFNAVPAKFARSRFVMSGTTRTDRSARRQSSSPAQRDEGPTAPWDAEHHPRLAEQSATPRKPATKARGIRPNWFDTTESRRPPSAYLSSNTTAKRENVLYGVPCRGQIL